MFRRRLLTTSLPKMFLGSLNQTWKILIRSRQSWQKAFLRVLQNVLLLKMILIWRMWLKKSLWSMFPRKPQKGFVSSGCKGRVSMVISALTYTHGFVGISSKGWRSFKGTTRYLFVFDELYSSISIKILV